MSSIVLHILLAQMPRAIHAIGTPTLDPCDISWCVWGLPGAEIARSRGCGGDLATEVAGWFSPYIGLTVECFLLAMIIELVLMVYSFALQHSRKIGPNILQSAICMSSASFGWCIVPHLLGWRLPGLFTGFLRFFIVVLTFQPAFFDSVLHSIR